MSNEINPTPPKAEKGSILEEKKQEEEILNPDYSDKEKDYTKNLQRRLDGASLDRNQVRKEFDGMSYTQYYLSNERLANTELRPTKNRSEINYQSGTLRNKMMAFLSSFQGLNLKPNISAFGQDEIPIDVYGNAMEDIIDKTEELENDEEKKMLRQYEMMKQGTVFLEELWEQKWETEKIITKGFIGMVKNVVWKTKKVLGIGAPKRNILHFLSVYLGDMTKYFIEDQPFIFTVETKSRVDAEAIYGSWERWKYVSKEKRTFSDSADGNNSIMENAWRFLSDTKKEEVEIIKYQDKPNNEFQIIINGVLMLPLGHPFPWKHGEYSIIQQNLEPIRHNFAIGKSFIFKNKNLVILLDEMMKLAVLKTQKSFMPPYLNTGSRIITKRVFMPGNIARGIEPGSLVPVSDKDAQGVTAGEFNMIQEVIRNIDVNTASQTFTGGKEKGKVTATQIIQLQKQAKVMMGLLILATTLLEKKLTMKRIMILLQNWFTPLDTVLDEARQELRKRYRITSRGRDVEGEGMGVRMTVIADKDNIPTPDQIMMKEDKLKEIYDKPFRITVLDPLEIKSAKLTWLVNILPKDKKSSESAKLMFEAMTMSAINLGLSLDKGYIEKRFAEVWEEDVKMFTQGEGGGAEGENVQPITGSNSDGSPRINPPNVQINTTA